MPATHATQVVALAAEPVLVIEPAAHCEQYDWPPFDWYWPALQSLHAAMFEAVEYFPAPHSVQVVAPAPEPVLVIDPGWQLSQYDWPATL